MGTLWLYAISVDEVRDIFGASEDDAELLRAVAARRFGQPAAHHGLLGKLGPLFARPVDAPVLTADSPTRDDCETLLAGQHVPPSRLTASWRLLAAWLEAKAWSTHSVALDEHSLNAIEFDLGRTQVPAKFSPRALLSADLGITLRPAPAMMAGYCPGDRASAAGRAWSEVEDQLEPASREWTGGITAWLAGFEEWRGAAEAAGRPRPDAVCLWWAD